MDLILLLVFFLCLMFLTMIFGEQLSLFGAVDGRWMTAPFDLITRFWGMVCELADRIWCFVFDHFWWVTATASGAVGIVLIAVIMMSGLSSQAHAVRVDEKSPLMAGSVLDEIPVLNAGTLLKSQTVASTDDSYQIYQYPSRNRWVVPTEIRRPVVSDFPPRDPQRYVPPMPLPIPRREPDYARSLLQITMEPFVERQGRRVRSDDVDRLIGRTLASLRRDEWRSWSDAAAMQRGIAVAGLRENSDREIEDLYDRVRVIPGDQVASNSVKVEKFVPDNPGAGDFDIEIRVTNLDRQRIEGLVVRELLPVAWVPVDIGSQGVYRNSVITWLIESINPQQEEVFTVRVRSSESGRFQSYTEVSATSAVSSYARIASPLPAVPRERQLPPVVRRPDVRLRLISEPPVSPTNEWVDVIFEISNIGDAPADGIILRVSLPFDLDHPELTDADINRRVDSKIRRLAPGEDRKLKLTVQATAAGRHAATAELLFQAAQLDVRTFEIVADRSLDEAPGSLVPRPDFR